MTGAWMSGGSVAGRALPATRGVVYLHRVPAALGPHVEWALASVVGQRVRLQFSPQAAAPGTLRAEVEWHGVIGLAARIVDALRAWPMLVFEVTENPTWASDGERLAYVPGRGVHRSVMSASGDIVVGEERLRGLAERCTSVEEFRHGLDEVLGTTWDDELERYRRGGAGAPVTFLHQVV